MLEDLESGREIAHACDRLLDIAEARRVLPTPVDRLVAAAELTEPEQSALSPNAISRLPKHLREVVDRLGRKVHAVLDRREKEVHLNPQIDHAGQAAFKRLHEVIHSALPWQDDLAYADDRLTLSPAVKQLQEQEANQGAAELLFQREFFREVASDYRIEFATVVELHNLFGSSIHAAFRRYAESHRGTVAGVVLEADPCQREPLTFRRREAVCSSGWRERFEDPRTWPLRLEQGTFGFVEQAQAVSGHSAATGSWSWPNLNSEPVGLGVEAFHNHYHTFVLIWKPQREVFKRRRRVIVPEAA